MAETLKVLGQAAPGADTDTDLYTVPASTQAVLSTIMVANRGATAATFRVAIRPDGAALANQHYIAYDVAVPANDCIPITIGATMDATDKVTVRASTANVSFNAFGSEIT